VIWQKLKNKIAQVIARAEHSINRLVSFLSEPMNLFRFVMILIAADFIAFMSLTRSSYLQLVNPLAFLVAGPSEKRVPIELHFPRSLSLTGIEKIYAEEGVAPETPGKDKLKAKEKEIPVKEITEAEIAAEVTVIKKFVAEPVVDETKNMGAAMARRVVLELIAGPAGEKETLKARNLLKEPFFLRSTWIWSDTLYISTERSVWTKMAPNEVKVTEYCLNESLKKNLGSQKFVLLKE